MERHPNLGIDRDILHASLSAAASKTLAPILAYSTISARSLRRVLVRGTLSSCKAKNCLTKPCTAHKPRSHARA